uniref:PBPe domain-containing protein n=1 Tax=Macrostomum lignano TaxID=282301 RepID=A0A1I8JER3_9PLAT
LLWNEEGTAALAKDLFEKKFRPAILEACPSAPGINQTSVEFVEIIHNKLMDIPAAMTSQLVDRPDPGLCCCPPLSRMRLHKVAPIPVSLVSDGVLRSLVMSLGASEAKQSRLSIILGTGYEAFHVEIFATKFPGSVQLYRLKPGAEYDLITRLQFKTTETFLLACKPEEAEVFLSVAFINRLLHPTYRWFLFNMASEVNRTVEGLTGSFSLGPDGTVTRKFWRMHFYKGLGDQRERIGNWSSSGDFFFVPAKPRIPTDEVLKQELNLNVFRVVTVLSPPFVQFRKGYENRTDVPLYNRLEGFAVDMCKKILMNMSLNSVEFFLQPDGIFGSYDPVKGWSGMVATLMLNDADMACASMSDTELRRGVVKFTQPILFNQLSILYSKPEVNPVELLFEFLSPLHLYTWLALLGSGFASGLVLAVLHRISRNEQRLSLYEAIYVALGTMIQGVKTTTPDRPSAKLVTVVFWLFVFLFLIIYVSNYAVKRTLKHIQTEIRGLESLQIQEAYEYGTLYDSVYLGFMKNSIDPLVSAAYQYIADNPERTQPRNISQALSLVNTGKFAFLYSNVLNEYYAKMGCGLKVVGSFGQETMNLGLPSSIEYDDLINKIIDRLISSGERDQLYKKYANPPESDLPDCTNKTLPYAIRDWIPKESENVGTRRSAVNLNHTLGITIINLVGCLLTLLLAALELAFQTYRQRLRRLRDDMLKDLSLRMESANAAAAGDDLMESNV